MSNRRRGRRYDETPKLNIKRVIVTILTMCVIAMVIISIKGMFTDKPVIKEEVVATAFFPAYMNGKCGVIDNNGNIVIGMSYDEMVIVPDSTKDLFICTYNIDYNTESFAIKVLNKNNQNIFTEFKNVQAIENSDGKNTWYENNILKFEENGKYGLIDFDGKVILNAEYDEIYAMEGIEKNIIIKQGDKIGLVNTSMGEIAISPTYDEISSLVNGKYENGYIVKQNDKYGIISADSKVIFEPQFEEIQNVTSDGYYVVVENGEKKLINDNKDLILKISYDKVTEIVGNNLVVEKGGKFGIIDLNGTQIIPNEYENIRHTFDKYYIAQKDGLYGIISTENEVKIDFKYTTMDYIKEADFIQADNDTYKTDIINRKFETVLSNIIVSEFNLENGYIRVRKDSDYKYYDFSFNEKSAQEILVSNTLFLVKENGKYGYENKKGERIVDCIYDDAKEQNKYGYCAVKKDGVWGVLKSDGTVILEPSLNLDKELYIDFVEKWHLDNELNIYVK